MTTDTTGCKNLCHLDWGCDTGRANKAQANSPLNHLKDLLTQVTELRNKVFPSEQSYGIAQESEHEKEAQLDSQNTTGSAEDSP